MGYGQYSNDGPAGKRNPLPEKKTRQRQVFPTDEIPHIWAHQRQDSARNAQGNLYFKGATIYSYRDSRPLARLYTRKGAMLVLSNSSTYGNTTAKHQSYVNRAVSHLQRIAVPVPAPRYPFALERKDHDANLSYLADVAAGALKKAQRVMTSQRYGWQRETAQRATADACHYMDFFGIRRKRPAFDTEAWAAAAARVRRIENPDPNSLDARSRASARRKELQAAKERAALANLTDHINAARTAWRLGDPLRMPPHPLAKGRYSYRHKVDPGPVMLRLDGDEIRTSMGARIPTAAAPLVWNLVERAIASGGREFTGALGRVKIADYPLDRIDADGTLHAGCHSIPHSELRMMARALGLV